MSQRQSLGSKQRNCFFACEKSRIKKSKVKRKIKMKGKVKRKKKEKNWKITMAEFVDLPLEGKIRTGRKLGEVNYANQIAGTANWCRTVAQSNWSLCITLPGIRSVSEVMCQFTWWTRGKLMMDCSIRHNTAWVAEAESPKICKFSEGGRTNFVKKADEPVNVRLYTLVNANVPTGKLLSEKCWMSFSGNYA